MSYHFPYAPPDAAPASASASSGAAPLPAAVLTHHARERAEQRGVPRSLIEAVHKYADLQLPVRHGRAALRLSSRALQCVGMELGATVADCAATVVLIVTGNVVVTVLRVQGAPSRRYHRRHR